MSNHLKDIFYDKESDWNNLDFKLKVRANPDPAMIDSVLTEKGKLQCANQREQQKVLLSQVKFVLVSPFSRCLQTTEGLFDLEDLQSRQGGVLVKQELREMLCCQSDLPTSIFQNIDTFKGYDFSEILSDVQMFKELFFVASMNEGALKKKIKEFALEQSQNGTKKQREAFMLELLRESVKDKRYLENQQETFVRINNFKNWVRDFIKEKGLKDGELAIVAHYGIIQAWTAQKVNAETGQYVDKVNAKNCQVVTVELS
jgi:broad specificity phosphatase PhoE